MRELKIKYYVITKINGANNYTPHAYKKDGIIYINDQYDHDFKSIPVKDWIHPIYANVFQIGELLIIDGVVGREGEFGRKPSKWDVEWREFDDPVKAMRFSNRLQSKIIYGKS